MQWLPVMILLVFSMVSIAFMLQLPNEKPVHNVKRVMRGNPEVVVVEPENLLETKPATDVKINEAIVFTTKTMYEKSDRSIFFNSQLVVLVLSAREHRSIRDTIRNTWAKGHTNVFFVVGKPCMYKKVDREAWTCHPKNEDASIQLTDIEQVEDASDLIIVDVVDVYRNLASKLHAAYYWVLENTDAQYILKTDDDTFVRVDPLQKWLQSRSTPPYEMIAADFTRNSQVHRRGKWAELSFSGNVYPPYPSGAGHIVNRAVLEYMHAHDKTWKSYQGEDTSMGIWIENIKKDIKITLTSEAKFVSHSGNCHDTTKFIIGHKISPQKLRACWVSNMYQLDYPDGMKQPLSWSQYGQDRYIAKAMPNGKYFVEIGGYDGEKFSNTLLLEKEYHWNGLLVEANPYTFEILKSRNRRAKSVNACIGKESLTFKISGSTTSALDLITDKHLKRVNNDINTYGKSGDKRWSHSGEEVKVKCVSLLSLVETTDIDYFSLDVEGGELYILKSLEWDRLNIKMFSIEVDQHKNEIIDFMESKGYTIETQLQGDIIFIKKSQPQLSDFQKPFDMAIKENCKNTPTGNMWQAFQSMVQILEHIQADYSISDGTVLFWYRDCTLGSSDIDMRIDLKWFTEHQKQLHTKLRASGWNMRESFGTFSKPGYEEAWIFKGVKCDLFSTTPVGDSYISGLTINGVTYPCKSFFTHTEQHTWGDVTFKVPVPIERYLEKKYGDWKEKHTTGYRWDVEPFKQNRDSCSKGETNQPKLFLCGYKLDYLSFIYPNREVKTYSKERTSTVDDVMLHGLFGPPCDIDTFKGKIIHINGESNTNVPKNTFGRGGKTFYYVQAVFQRIPDGHKLITHRPKNTKEKFMYYAQKNCVSYRDDAFDKLSTINHVEAVGACKNNVKGFYPRAKWTENWHYFSAYRFGLCMENTNAPGYITEKILMAFFAGVIPVYYGTEEVFDIFNHKAFIYYDIENPEKAIARIKHLEENPDEYEKMLNEPILNDGSYGKYFSKEAVAATLNPDDSIMGLVEQTTNKKPHFFIYDDDDITMSGWSKVCDAHSTADIDMINQAMKHSLRTLDPEKAQLFIVPIPVYQSFRCDPTGHISRMERAFNKLFGSKWFNNGKNHVMSGHNYMFSAWVEDKNFIPNKIWSQMQEMMLLRYEVYNSSMWRSPKHVREPDSLYGAKWERTKHSIITPYSDHEGVPLVTTLPSVSEWQRRENLIWYHTRKRGSAHGGTILRRKPLEVSCNECSVGYDIPRDEWLQGWQKSRFCLVIRGDTPTSHAFYNAIRSFCIPVIISDGFEAVGLPFRTKLNLGAFSVRITEANFIDGGMNALIKRLNTLEKDTIRNKLLQLKAVQGDLIWDYPDGRVFNNILEEIV